MQDEKRAKKGGFLGVPKTAKNSKKVFFTFFTKNAYFGLKTAFFSCFRCYRIRHLLGTQILGPPGPPGTPIRDPPGSRDPGILETRDFRDPRDTLKKG